MALSGDQEVVVIGSGAGGGMSAYLLTRAGIKVALLEAGRDYDPYTETPMYNRNHGAPLLGSGTPDKEFGFYHASIGGG